MRLAATLYLGHGAAEVCLDRRISDIENVDLTQAIARMTQDQMVIESAMATIARLNQVPLADFPCRASLRVATPWSHR